MKCFCVNIILLLHSCSLFHLPLVFWEKASLPCVDNYRHHGLIVCDGNPLTVNPPDIGCDEGVIGEAVVVVYDITNPSSFDEAKDRVEEYWRYRIHRWRSRPLVGLVGSKADLWMHRKIKYEVLSCYNYIHVKLPWNWYHFSVYRPQKVHFFLLWFKLEYGVVFFSLKSFWMGRWSVKDSCSCKTLLWILSLIWWAKSFEIWPSRTKDYFVF